MRRNPPGLTGPPECPARLARPRVRPGDRRCRAREMRYIVLTLSDQRGRPAEEQMATTSGLRIGDADREAAAAALREHFAQGRLTHGRVPAAAGACLRSQDRPRPRRDHPRPPSSHASARLAAGRKQARSAHAGSRDWRSASGPRRRSGFAAFAGLISFVVVILALILIAFILPVAFIGTMISRSLLFVLMALLFGRRGLLRRFRRWLPRSMRRTRF